MMSFLESTRVLPVLRSLWIWGATAVLFVMWTMMMAIVRLFDRDPKRLRTARCFRRLGHALAAINPWSIHVSSRENLRPGQVYVIVSNHQSFADIPVVAHLNVDAKWLGKAELFRTPVIGWMLKMAQDIPVERGDRSKSARALLQCARQLRDGCSVVFFPEGTRSLDGQVRPFNDGPFQLAIREGVPILPVVVDGTGDALPRHSWIFGAARNIHLSVLEPVSVEGWTVKQSGQLRDEVRRAIVEELACLRGMGHVLACPDSPVKQ
jgi:1-acyl-sn-glycerol-3-phosphate acyltransferase